jgi:outer membrane protein assembly factor BamB
MRIRPSFALLAGLAALLVLPSIASAAVLAGDTVIESTVDGNVAGAAEAFQATAGASGVAGTVTVYVDATSTATSLVAGVYADNGGHPGTLLAQGTLSPLAAAAWNNVAIPSVSINAGSIYWIALLAPAGTLHFRSKHTGHSEAPATNGLTSLPSTWTTGATYADTASAYLQSTAVTVPVLSVSPLSLSFAGQVGGAAPPTQTVSVANVGAGSLSFTTASDASWLTATPASGTAPATVTVAASQLGLAAGAYTGHVTIAATGVQGSPQVVTVSLNVTTPSTGGPADWTTIDHDPARTGDASGETTIGPAEARTLGQLWSTTLDGKITSQPLYVAGVQAGGATHNLLIAATDQNSLYGVDADTGAVVWRRAFGAPPPNIAIPGGFGIIGAPVVDSAAGRIYVVTDGGSLVTVSLANGADVAPPLALIDRPSTNKVWGGLNLVGGNLYVATASDGADTAPWRGQVYRLGTGTSTPSPLAAFAVVPSIPAPNGGGGIWGYGGVSVDTATGHVYAATGDDSNEGYTPYGDEMVALDAGLNVLGSWQPSQPNNFPCAGAPCDLDFGATPVVFTPQACPTMVAAGNKDGNLYVFKTADLEASRPPFQTLALNPANDWLGSGGVGGVPAYWKAGRMLFVSDAGTGLPGIAAGIVGLTVQSDCTLKVAWSQPIGGNTQPNSTPTVANGVVYVGDGNGGRVHAYDALSGTPLWDSGANAAGSTYAAPMVAAGKLYSGSWDGSSTSSVGTLRAFAPGAGSTQVALGDTTIEGQKDFTLAGNAEAFQVTGAVTGSVGTLNVYVDTGSAATKIVAGLYADAGGHPGALLASGQKLAPASAAWAAVAIPATSITAGTKYWLAVTGGTTGTLRFRDRHRGPCSSELAKQTTLDALPTAWTTGTTYTDCPLSGYGTLLP